MIQVGRVEIHIADDCQLSCPSCSHWANYQRPWHKRVAPRAVRLSAEPWANRISPREVCLLGGEPLLRPWVGDSLRILRRCWPEAKLLLCTNGHALPNVPRDLLPAIIETGTRVIVSDHGALPMASKAVVAKWAATGVNMQVLDARARWTLRYKGRGDSALPFADEQPRAAWEICEAKHCHQLRDGWLYKCPFLAYLPEGVAPGPWGRAIEYRKKDVLLPTASDAEITAWLAREEESVCGLCSATRRTV